MVSSLKKSIITFKNCVVGKLRTTIHNIQNLDKNVLPCCGVLICILGSYGFARSITDSLFIEQHTSAKMPYVYLLSTFGTIIVSTIYNHFCLKFPLIKIFRGILILSILIMVIGLISYHFNFIWSIYFLYIWREIYMVVLVENFWSLADALFTIETAKRSYGIILASGSIIGFLINWLVGILCIRFGSKLTLLGVIPCLLIPLILTKYLIIPYTKDIQRKQEKKTFNIEIVKVIYKSHYLLPLLALIGTIQIAVSLIDLQFNRILEITYVNPDIRSSAIAKIHGQIDIVSIGLQILSSPLIRTLGLKGVFAGIPIILGLSIVLFIFTQSFAAIALVKLLSKCFDYSIFRSSKELFYIPLNKIEKTQGKAFIDILVYRTAKSVAALLMLLLKFLKFENYCMNLVLVLMIIWIILSTLICNRYTSANNLKNDKNY